MVVFSILISNLFISVGLLTCFAHFLENEIDLKPGDCLLTKSLGMTNTPNNKWQQLNFCRLLLVVCALK